MNQYGDKRCLIIADEREGHLPRLVGIASFDNLEISLSLWPIMLLRSYKKQNKKKKQELLLTWIGGRPPNDGGPQLHNLKRISSTGIFLDLATPSTNCWYSRNVRVLLVLYGNSSDAVIRTYPKHSFLCPCLCLPSGALIPKRICGLIDLMYQEAYFQCGNNWY